MGIRDRELLQLEYYAWGLGIKVTWRKSKRNSPGATWSNSSEGSEIEMFVYPGQTKTQQILNFLHELAHHVGFIYNGRRDSPELLAALTKENADEELNKAERKLIYECEKSDAQYRITIARELGLKLPETIILQDIDLDVYVYWHFYLYGEYPTMKKIRKKKRQIKEKYKNGN